MAWRYEIRLAGSGGQGIILMGIILAKAIGLYEGYYVTQTQSYGPEARGGASKAEIVVSDEEIDYPKVIKPNLFLAMNQKAFDNFITDVDRDGIVIIDSTNVDLIPVMSTFDIPFSRLGREKFGREIMANIIALGAITEITDMVSQESMKEAVLESIPKGTEEMNLKALDVGIEAGKKAKNAGAKRAFPTEVPQKGILGYY